MPSSKAVGEGGAIAGSLEQRLGRPARDTPRQADVLDRSASAGDRSGCDRLRRARLRSRATGRRRSPSRSGWRAGDDGRELRAPVGSREERGPPSRATSATHASWTSSGNEHAAAVRHPRSHAVERRAEIGRRHERERRRGAELRTIQQRRVLRSPAGRSPPRRATRRSANANRCAIGRRSHRTRGSRRSSPQVTNGERPSSPFSVIRAGIAYAIARRPYCFSSGAATSATLFQASSKHRPTERAGSSRSPRDVRAISSEVTVR